MTSPSRIRMADLIGRHLVAFHRHCPTVRQSERAAMLANAIICAEPIDLSTATRAALLDISMEPPADGGPTSAWGIRTEAASHLVSMDAAETDESQRWRLRGIASGLVHLWTHGTPHHTQARAVMARTTPMDPTC
jgi:hypothetical protein